MDSSALQTLNFYQRLQYELEVENLVSQNRELKSLNDDLKQKLTTACKNPFKDNLSFDFKQIYQMEIERLNNCLERESRITKTWRFAFYQLARQMDPHADHARNSLMSAQAIVLLEEAMKRIDFYEKNYVPKATSDDLKQGLINNQSLLSPSSKGLNHKSPEYSTLEAGAQTFFSKIKQQVNDKDTKLLGPIDANNIGDQFNEVVKSDRDDYASTDAAMTDVANEEFSYSNGDIEEPIKISTADDECPNSNIYSPLNYLDVDPPDSELPYYDSNDKATNDTDIGDYNSNDSDTDTSSPTSPENKLDIDSPIIKQDETTCDLDSLDESLTREPPKDSSEISEHIDSDALFMIESSPHLKHLPINVQRNISKRLCRISFYPNASVIIQGEPPNGFYIISSGTASISYYNGAGYPLIECGKLGAGDIFGHHNIISDEPHPSYVVAKSHLTLFKLSIDDWNELSMRDLLANISPLPLPSAANFTREELVDYLINLNEFKNSKIRKISKYLNVHRLVPGERVPYELSNEHMIIVRRGTIIDDLESSKYFIENNVINPCTEDRHLRAADYCILFTLSPDKIKKYFLKEVNEPAEDSKVSFDPKEDILTPDGADSAAGDYSSSKKSHNDKPNSKLKRSNSDKKSNSADSTANPPTPGATSSKDGMDLPINADVSVKDHPLYNFFRSIGKKSLNSQENFKTPFPFGSNLSRWFAGCFEKHVLKQDSSIVSPEIFVVTKGRVTMKHVGHFGSETNVRTVPRGKIIGLESESDCNYCVQSSSATVYILPCKLHDKIIMCLKEWDKIVTFAQNITGSTDVGTEISNVLALGPGESAAEGKYIVYSGKVSTDDGIKTIGQVFNSEAVSEQNSILLSLFVLKSCLKKGGRNIDKHVSFSTKHEVVY